MFKQERYTPSTNRPVASSHVLSYTSVPEEQLGQKLPATRLSWGACAALEVLPEINTYSEARRFDRENPTFFEKALKVGTAALETGLAYKGLEITLDQLQPAYERYVEGPVRKFGRLALNFMRKSGEIVKNGIEKFNDAGEWVLNASINALGGAVRALQAGQRYLNDSPITVGRHAQLPVRHSARYQHARTLVMVQDRPSDLVMLDRMLG